VQSVELFRTQDVTSVYPWWQRMVGIGAAVVTTSDSSNPVWQLLGMEDAEQLRNELNRAAIAFCDIKGVGEGNMGLV
jgi:hypothetical protein